MNKKDCILAWPKSRNAVRCPQTTLFSQFSALLKLQLWELKVIKQTILLQNHWSEQAQKYDSVSPRRQEKASSSQHDLSRKSPNTVYCTVSVSVANTNNVIRFSEQFAHNWHFSALILLLHLFNIQAEAHFNIALWAGIDWGTFALLWQRTKLCSWQMSQGEREREK